MQEKKIIFLNVDILGRYVRIWRHRERFRRIEFLKYGVLEALINNLHMLLYETDETKDVVFSTRQNEIQIKYFYQLLYIINNLMTTFAGNNCRL